MDIIVGVVLLVAVADCTRSTSPGWIPPTAATRSATGTPRYTPWPVKLPNLFSKADAPSTDDICMSCPKLYLMVPLGPLTSTLGSVTWVCTGWGSTVISSSLTLTSAKWNMPPSSGDA